MLLFLYVHYIDVVILLFENIFCQTGLYVFVKFVYLSFKPSLPAPNALFEAPLNSSIYLNAPFNPFKMYTLYILCFVHVKFVSEMPRLMILRRGLIDPLADVIRYEKEDVICYEGGGELQIFC